MIRRDPEGRDHFEGQTRSGEEGLAVSVGNVAEKARPAEVRMSGPSFDLRRAFHEHADRLHGFLTRLGVDRDEAEDLVSETFLIAHRSRGRFDETRSLRPWLYGIAANLARRHRRKKWLWRALSSRAVSDLTAEPPPPDLERSLLEAEDKWRVQKTLASMPEKKRMVLVMREYEDLSTAEIAEALGIPENTVYSSLHYARKEFVRRYRQQLVLEGSR
jgi:RNA polymerase sigma-70 factor (ECF subfamily)